MRSARLAICLLLALSFALAPLLCLRYCQAIHAARMMAMQMGAATLTHAGQHTVPPPATREHHPPLNELAQMLAAMMSVLPTVAALFIGLTLTRAIAQRSLSALDAALPIILPPPRTGVL
jgi:fucose 4-O-acetylase-like acetyltransferase